MKQQKKKTSAYQWRTKSVLEKWQWANGVSTIRFFNNSWWYWHIRKDSNIFRTLHFQFPSMRYHHWSVNHNIPKRKQEGFPDYFEIKKYEKVAKQERMVFFNTAFCWGIVKLFSKDAFWLLCFIIFSWYFEKTFAKF